MRLLIGKGLAAENCFLFDSFPRRVITPKDAEKKPAQVWPEFEENHDDLHIKYREEVVLGVILLLGGAAEKAYNRVVQKCGQKKVKKISMAGFRVGFEQVPLTYVLELNFRMPLTRFTRSW